MSLLDIMHSSKSKAAQELGLSTKTVRRRFQRMIDNNVIILPAIQPGDVPNTITHVLLLFHHLMEREKDHALIRSLDYGILLIGGKKEKNND